MPDFQLPSSAYERPGPFKYGSGPGSGFWYDQATTRMKLGRVRTPEEHGAVGDGTTDDTTAILALFAAAASGDTLYFAPTKTYRFAKPDSHLHIQNKNGVTIIGRNSRIHATVYAESGFQLENCHDWWIEGLTLSTDLTGASRGSSPHHHRFTLWNCAGFTGIDMRIHGSYAAGIFVIGSGSENFQFIRPIVRHTRADAIHVTGAARYGWVQQPQCHHIGDDMMAVVSYNGDSAQCQFITCDGGIFGGQYHGRGMTVVGGSDIEYRGNTIYESRAAGFYCLVENGGWVTKSTQRVKFLGNTLIGCSQVGAVENHPPILVGNQASDGRVVDDIEIAYNVIQDAPGPRVPMRLEGSASANVTNVRAYGNQIYGSFLAGSIDGWIDKHTGVNTPTVTGDGSSQGVNNIPVNRVRAF